jgi:tetratricopeptide (TPR) repeat protein
MAAKVNKTVVFALIGGVICVVGGVMFLMTVVLKSGADLAAQGDRLMEAKKFDEAASSYSKAVNKDQNNVEYIRKWAASLSAQTPSSLQAYSDRYRAWLATQRLIANVLRTDPAAHKVVLDMILRDARMSPRSGPVWQSLESDASDIINRMKSEPQDKIDQIRRYRGIATIGKMGQSLEVPVEDRKRAKEDLLAAMKQNPDDSLAAIYYSDAMRLGADKLRQGSNAEEADATIAEGLAVMQEFCAKHPTSTVARLGLLQLEISDLTAKARANPAATDEYQKQLKTEIDTLVATLESEDPKVVDEFVATQVLDMAVRDAGNKNKDAIARGARIFEKIKAARPDEPFPRLMHARFYATTNSPREAADAFKAILELPNQHVSPNGLSLFGVRDSAAVQRVDALLALTEQLRNKLSQAQQPSVDQKALAAAQEALTKAQQAKPVDPGAVAAAQAAVAKAQQPPPADPANIAAAKAAVDAALAETRAARDELKTRSTVDEAPKTLIDAKIALLANDNAEARKLLGQYHQLTGFSDAAALDLSARVLFQQGLKNEAKTMLIRIVDKRIAGPAVYKLLTRIDSDLSNFPSALNWCEFGLNMAPDDEDLKMMHERIVTIIEGTNNKDPLRAAIAEANQALLQTPPDVQTSRAKAMLALPLCVKANDFGEVAYILRRSSRADALMAVNRGLEKFPDDQQLLAAQKIYKIEDPFLEGIKQIEAAGLNPIDKYLRLYLAYVQSNRPDAAKLANENLDAAAKIDPEHPLVVAGLFERALAAGKFDEAAVLAQKARDKSLDKVDGRVYAARLAQAKGDYATAIPLLERASETDAFNPLTWRYLGSAYMAVGEKNKALRAFERSLQIKGDDIATIVARIQAMMTIDRMGEALAAAREAARLGISNPVFVHMWLMLEFRAPGGDKELALSRREFIRRTEPNNIDNAMEYAKCLIEVKRLDDAERVMTEVEKSELPPEARQSLALPLGMLRAALRGSRGDPAGSLADLEKLTASMPPERREGAYIEFANIADSLTNGNAMVIQVLEAGRKYQDAKPENGKSDTPPAARIDRMLGDTFFAAGEWEKARAAYTRARETVAVDNDKLLLKRIIECCMKSQQFGEAHKMLDAEGGAKSNDMQILLLASQLALAENDKPRALELLDRAQGAAPNNSLPYRQRGLLKMDDPKTVDDAIVDFELAVGLEPRNTDLVILLSRAYMKKGDPAHALGAVEKALAIQSDNAPLRNEHVQQLMNQGKVPEAMASLDLAIKADPNNTRWYLLRGVILQRENKQREAADEYEQAWKIRHATDTGKAFADALIAAYDKSNPKERALLDRAKAVIDDPAFNVEGEPVAKLTRMAYFLRLGKRPEAVADLRAIVTSPGTNLNEPQICTYILDELRRAFTGDMKQVVPLLDEVKPAKDWPDMFTLTLVRAKLSEPTMRDAAMSGLESLTKSPDKAVSMGAASSLGANAYLDAVNAGKKTPVNKADVDAHYQRAVNAFQSGLAMDSDNVELNNNMAFVLAKGMNRPADALPYATKAAAKDPNNPNILDTLGAVQSMLDDLSNAEKTLGRALAATTDAMTRTMPLIHMVEVKLKKKDAAAAGDLYRELLNLQAAEPRIKATYGKDIEEIAKKMQPAP